MCNPRSATAMSQNHLNHSEMQIKFTQKEQFQKENYIKREQGTIERLLQEQLKQEKRSRYHRQMTNQIQESEKRRTETNIQKSFDVARAKEEKNAVNLERIEGSRVDGEAKEQAKIQHLREGVNKRAQEQSGKVENEVRREENKIVSFFQNILLVKRVHQI